MTSDCWTWQNDAVAKSHGAFSGWRSYEPLQANQNYPQRNIDYWLEKDNPEMAVIMLGTNDQTQAYISVADYKENIREIVVTCKENGTIPIVSTIPPHYNYLTRSADFAQAVRDLAAEESIPLIDFYNEIVTRQPNGAWNGALLGYNNVHPTNTSAYQRNFSETGLSYNGYNLRNYLTLHATHDVYEKVIVPEPATMALMAFGLVGGIVRRKSR
jgi:hypothetical protein